MGVLCTIMKASFQSSAVYGLLNRTMMNKIRRQQKAEGEPVGDVGAILEKNGLEIVEAEFFRQKRTVFRVKDAEGNFCILKTGRIDPFQLKLFHIAKKIEKQLCFKVPDIQKAGDDWILMKEIIGKSLNEFYRDQPDYCFGLSKKISDDYQKVIREFLRTESVGELLAEGEWWLYSRLNLWTKPILDAGLIDFLLVQRLKRDFQDVIRHKGEAFFSWNHGNIIGDHVFISAYNEVYLIDLNAVSRIGSGYYDFLRALDFMFLKVEDNEEMFAFIISCLKQYLTEFDEEEIKLVFAFRCLGILGWDILQHKVEYTKGNLEIKKQLILKFIKRVY